jgi:hypothetical protein
VCFLEVHWARIFPLQLFEDWRDFASVLSSPFDSRTARKAEKPKKLEGLKGSRLKRWGRALNFTEKFEP